MNTKIKTAGIIFCTFVHITGIAQDTQGFFLDDFEPKNAHIPAYKEYTEPQDSSTVNVKLEPLKVVAKVSKYVYGNNANVYMTQMITQDTLIQWLSLLSPNIIRYPGGNLSNLFFWNAKPGELSDDVPNPLWGGIEEPYQEEFWYGRNTDPSTLSVDNYYKMLEMISATGIITINYSYARYGLSDNPVAAAAHLAAEWVRYDKGRTRYWEIGNENYGPWQTGYKIDTSKNKDGQPEYITGELYGTHFKVFADSMRMAAQEVGNDIKIGASLVETANSWAKDPEKYWNEGFFKAAGNTADFFVIHSYYTPYKKDSDIPTILNSAAQETKQMRDFVIGVCQKNNVQINPLALTEWNIFAVKSKQSCSYISGIHAALTLGELIKNKYGQANRWDLANAYANGDDHGLFNNGDEPDVPKWNPRPAYFYMYYFQRFFGDHMIEVTVEGNEDIVAYGSTFISGEYSLIIINKGPNHQIIHVESIIGQKARRYYFYLLTGGDDNGDFSQQVWINDHPPTYLKGGPIDGLEQIKAWSAKTGKDGIVLKSPAHSVQYILFGK